MKQIHSKKQDKKWKIWGSLIFFLCILVLFAVLSTRVKTANETQQMEILEKAVTRTITECYALEGAYPPDIDYLTAHYGLTYDADTYFIDYQYIGSNLRPDVTIIKRNR